MTLKQQQNVFHVIVNANTIVQHVTENKDVIKNMSLGT